MQTDVKNVYTALIKHAKLFDQMHLAKRCAFDQMPPVLPIGQMRCAFDQMCKLVKCALQ